LKRRKPIKQVSSKQAIIKYCDKLLFEILKIKRGDKCEVCGRPNPAPHHVFFKGEYPRLRFREDNIILMCWSPCHFSLHHQTHDHPHYKRSYAKIKELLGCNFYDKLKIANKCAPMMSIFQLQLVRMALKQELKELEG